MWAFRGQMALIKERQEVSVFEAYSGQRFRYSFRRSLLAATATRSLLLLIGPGVSTKMTSDSLQSAIADV
jgi:hypothetical protein